MSKKFFTIAAAIFIIVFCALLYTVVIKEDAKSQKFAQEQIKSYRNEAVEKQKTAELKEEEKNKLLERVPGIVCWGDDMTAGQGGTGTTYPEVLEDMLRRNDLDIPVVNMGIADESNLEILARCGAIPMVIADDVVVKSNGELTKVLLKNTAGQDVHPLIHTINPGVNPVKINGIEYTLYGNIISSTDYGVNEYYLAMKQARNNTNIAGGSVIETSGSAYKDNINIFEISSHGGYANDDELVSQLKTFISHLGKNRENYLILSNINTSAETAARLSKEFGVRYLDTRQYFVDNARNISGFEITEQDSSDITNGTVPTSLRHDENNLNDAGYRALGNCIYNKLVELKYFDFD